MVRVGMPRLPVITRPTKHDQRERPIPTTAKKLMATKKGTLPTGMKQHMPHAKRPISMQQNMPHA